MQTLANNSYIVTPGSATTFPGCSVFITALASCFGNNTATPYIFAQPPITSSSTLPSWAGSGSGLTGSAGSQATDDVWQIGPDEAIVTVITLPPQGAYFGFQSYAVERDPVVYGVPAPTGCAAGTPDGSFTETSDCGFEVFGNFTNTINNADAAQIASFSGSAWNTYNDTNNPPTPTSFKTIAIITSPNSTLVGKMQALFSGDSTTVFTEEMPSVPTGPANVAAMALYPCLNTVANGCDVYTSLIRFTLAQNQAESTAWQTGNNVLVYRVELPGVGTASSDLYDTESNYTSLYKQGCNTNETGAAKAPSFCAAATLASASFDYDLQQIAAVLKTWGTNNNGDSYGAFEASGTGTKSTNGQVGDCVANGNNCAGGTQDTDFYRAYLGGKLKNLAPVFVVGVLHSDSPNDFAPNGGSVQTAPVNNADYTGISIADDSTMFMNTGVADAANPNSTSEYYVPPSQRILLGSAYTVLNYLTDGSPATTLYSRLPTTVQEDLDNIYIHVFQRNDSYNQACTMQTCANALANDVTTIIDADPAPKHGSTPASIPDDDPTLFTERGYVLPPIGADASKSILTGAAVQYLQSPYIVCDIAGTGCSHGS